MRCLRCLNGIELPDMTPEGRRSGAKKALVVKVDEKTRQFLEDFESNLGRSDDDEEGDSSCRKSIAHIVALLTDPNAPAPRDFKGGAGGRSPINVVVPAHLQDLKEGDLPEEQRVVVLDQIAIFRENAARREREKQRLETEKEKMKMVGSGSSKTDTSSYGYGTNRGLEQDRQRASRQWGPSPTAPNGGSSSRAHGRDDPQGYDKPVNFVKPQTVEAKAESERTDEEEEELRRIRRDREREHALREVNLSAYQGGRILTIARQKGRIQGETADRQLPPGHVQKTTRRRVRRTHATTPD